MKKRIFNFKYLFFLLLFAVFTFGISFAFEKTDENKKTYADSWINQPSDLSFLQTGDGTIHSPYLISNAEQFATVSRNIALYNSNAFCLTDNIDISQFEWYPIGTKNIPYSGVFDGNGFTVSGLTILNAPHEYAGLFGYLNLATVKNLTISSRIIKAEFDLGVYAGGLAGYINQSSIQNITHISGNVFGKSSNFAYVGGLVGYWSTSGGKYLFNYACVTSISGNGRISAAGGIIGMVNSNANILTLFKNGGNIVALSTDEASRVYAGGIVAFNVTEEIMTAMANDGSITANSSENTFIFNEISYNIKKTVVAHAGGITGSGGVISNSMNFGNITSRAKEVERATALAYVSVTRTNYFETKNFGFLGIGAWKDYMNYYPTDYNNEKLKTVETKIIETLAYAGGISGYAKDISYSFSDSLVTGGTVKLTYTTAITAVRKREYMLKSDYNYLTAFFTIKKTTAYLYSSINGFRSETLPDANNFGNDACLVEAGTLEVNLKVDGKKYSSTHEASINKTVQLIVDFPYVNSVHAKIEKGQNNAILFSFYFMHDNGTIYNTTNSNGNTLTARKYTVKSSDALNAGDLKTSYWKQGDILGGRPYLDGLYW